MAHESFEDPDVAAEMNRHFVNVKVDREERPDLDQIYQRAHALMTRRSGGWPLTMFLAPDGTPFFGGTYFPREGRYGLPGFLDLLPRVAAAYRESGPAIAANREALQQAMESLEPGGEGGSTALPAQAPAAALAALKQAFDPVHGGFGGAPKFPHPFELRLALRAHAATGDAEALSVVRTTLDRMSAGGIHDQLGGGFCRYSVDAEWAIPHFEKMLYDNGPLLALYADAARVTGERSYAATADATVAWLLREMRAPDHAFYASLDADSEGEEGRHYLWTRDEVAALLAADEFAVAAPHYGLDGPPNFEGHAWNLRIAVPLADVATGLGLTTAEAAARLGRAKAKLFAARALRVRPGRDDKILTSWNALLIAGLARAARALQRPEWAGVALAAADAIRATAWRDGRLLATRKDGPAQLNAYLDDHAFLLAALLELLQTRFRIEDYDWACALADALLDRFEDREHGGFWFTSHDHERLFHRTKPGPDNATPSGNGVAAGALIALGHLAGEVRYVEAAERALALFAPSLARSPEGHATLLEALEDALSPPTVVLLDGDAAATAAWRRSLERAWRPGVLVVDVAGAAVPPALVKGPPPSTGAVAWVCRRMACLPAIRSLPELEREVGGG
jgi:hypothetical protein